MPLRNIGKKRMIGIFKLKLSKKITQCCLKFEAKVVLKAHVGFIMVCITYLSTESWQK